MSKDPTLELVRAIERSDPKEWGLIKDGIPIFRAHKWWERKTPQGTECKTTLPGEPDLDTADGWKLCYEVTEDELDEVSERINSLFDDSGDPVKLMVGHTRHGRPQEEQPALAGYGCKTRVGTFGPKNIKAVLAKAYCRPGYEDVLSEYPQRSPEFSRTTGRITGVALLKTDPRLPMGFSGYAEKDEVSFYGVGFMADESEKKSESKSESHAPPASATPATPAASPSTPAPGPVQGPTTPEAALRQELAPLTPEEASQAMRYMSHYEAHHPAFKYLTDQYKKYSAEQAAMAPASATNGQTPANPIGKEKDKDKHNPSPDANHRMEEDDQMQDLEEKRLYEERLLALETENARLYADKQYESMSRKRKISDPKKFRSKLVELRVGAKDDATRDTACKEFLDEVLQNYAVVEKAPVGNHFLPIPQDEPDLPAAQPDIDLNDPEVVSAVVRYAEDSKIDASTEDGWESAVAGFVEAKKKKQQNRQQTQRQTA